MRLKIGMYEEIIMDIQEREKREGMMFVVAIYLEDIG